MKQHINIKSNVFSCPAVSSKFQMHLKFINLKILPQYNFKIISSSYYIRSDINGVLLS